LLASFVVNNPAKQTLPDWLETNVFAGTTGTEIVPTPEEVEGFNKYIEAYKKGLEIEKMAVERK
ncbi:MAG: ATPase, partial [Bacteroidales bacterium]|nr:ATPase [Bacteroidales bacterium]